MNPIIVHLEFTALREFVGCRAEKQMGAQRISLVEVTELRQGENEFAIDNRTEDLREKKNCTEVWRSAQY